MSWIGGGPPAQPSRRCTTCGTLHGPDPRNGDPGRACYVDSAFMPEMHGVELTERDRSKLAWLAGFVSQVQAEEWAAFFRRLREAGPSKGSP